VTLFLGVGPVSVGTVTAKNCETYIMTAGITAEIQTGYFSNTYIH